MAQKVLFLALVSAPALVPSGGEWESLTHDPAIPCVQPLYFTVVFVSPLVVMPYCLQYVAPISFVDHHNKKHPLKDKAW